MMEQHRERALSIVLYVPMTTWETTHAHTMHTPTTGKTPYAYGLWLLHWSTIPQAYIFIRLKLIHNNFMVYVYLMVFLMWIDKKWTIMLRFFNNSVQVLLFYTFILVCLKLSTNLGKDAIITETNPNYCGHCQEFDGFDNMN